MSEKPSSSSWWRIAPIRPSIMSLGATTSAPASAWEIAVLASSSIVRSLSTSPSRTNPQWPCEVYSQRQTSVITTRSGCGLLERPDRHLDDALVVVGARADLVLAGGNPEQHHGRHASAAQLGGLGDQLGDREALDPGHRSRRARARPRRRSTNSGWIRCTRRELRLADEVAQHAASGAGGAGVWRESSSRVDSRSRAGSETAPGRASRSRAAQANRRGRAARARRRPPQVAAGAAARRRRSGRRRRARR